MKNLLIHINPKKSFTDDWGDEVAKLVKVQIDNSLELGWKREDIILITNFPYEYNGVKAIEMGDDLYCEYRPTVTKIYVVCEMFKREMIDDIYWFHDFDAFQMEELTPPDCDIAMTDYGILGKDNANNLRPSTGIIFFKKEAREFFEAWKQECDVMKNNEEVVLLAMSHKSRFKHFTWEKLNITHNFATRRRNIKLTYEIADKPIKVIHFHPFDKRPLHYVRPPMNNIDVCINEGLGFPLVTDRLKNLFKKHL